MLKQRKKKHKILVVEDDRTTRKLLTMILEKEGYEVLECGEGRDAIHLAQMSQPAIMLIDVMLPDMEGTQIVDEIRYFPQCRHIKSIFLTAILKNKDVSEKCQFKIEGKNYKALAKPVRKSLLLKLLSDSINEAFEEQEELERQESIKAERELLRREELREKNAVESAARKKQHEEAPWYQPEDAAAESVPEDNV